MRQQRRGARVRAPGSALSVVAALVVTGMVVTGMVAAGAAEAQTIIPGSRIAQPPSLTGGQGIGFQARRGQGEAAAMLSPVTAIDVSRFAFTAPGKAPARATGAERSFQFTPSSASDRRPVALAMATRTSAPAPASAPQARAASAASSIGPESYGFDLSLAWRGLALSGDVERTVGLADSQSEKVGLGLSYGGRSWRTGIRASAERGGNLLPLPDAALTERLALEASGAVSVARSVSVGGTVRYQMAPLHPTPLDPNKDDRAVFLGGKVDF